MDIHIEIRATFDVPRVWDVKFGELTDFVKAGVEGILVEANSRFPAQLSALECSTVTRSHRRHIRASLGADGSVLTYDADTGEPLGLGADPLEGPGGEEVAE